MSLNFKTYKKENPNGPGGDFSPLPTDRYDVEVEKADLFIADSGNACIKTQFVVLSDKFKNRKLWTNFTLIPSSMGFVFALLESNESALLDQDGVENEAIAEALVGMRSNAYVEPDSYGDKPGNKIGGFKPVKGEYGTEEKAPDEPAKGSNLFG
jgi:hypothetical protein